MCIIRIVQGGLGMEDKKLILAVYVDDENIYIKANGENTDFAEAMAMLIVTMAEDNHPLTTDEILGYIRDCINRG